MDMVFATMVVFGGTLGLIIFLFIFKSIEIRRGARFAEPLRARSDRGALRVKGVLMTGEWYLEQTPWFLSTIARYGVHVGALSFARLARTSAEYAHTLADFVSHKRGFERRETKSQYLKEVSGTPRYVPETTYVPPAATPELLPREPEPAPLPVPPPPPPTTPPPLSSPTSKPELHIIRPYVGKPRGKKRRSRRSVAGKR